MWRLPGLCLLLMSTQVNALERMSEKDVRDLLNRQSLLIMHKDIDALMALYDAGFQQIIPAENNRVIGKEEVRKVWNANFSIATHILNTLDIRQLTLRDDGRQAVVKTHIRNRYLIQLKERQDVLEQDDDYIVEVALKQGEPVFVSMEKL